MRKPEKLETQKFQQSRNQLFPQPAIQQWLALLPDQDAESQAQALIASAVKTHAQAVVLHKVAEVAAVALRDGEEALFFRAVELCGPQLLAQPIVRDELVGVGANAKLTSQWGPVSRGVGLEAGRGSLLAWPFLLSGASHR